MLGVNQGVTTGRGRLETGPCCVPVVVFLHSSMQRPEAEETEAPGLVRIGDHVKAPAEIIFRGDGGRGGRIRRSGAWLQHFHARGFCVIRGAVARKTLVCSERLGSSKTTVGPGQTVRLRVVRDRG